MLPLAARAQQSGRMRRVGILMAFDENDPASRAFLSAFAQGLPELGCDAQPAAATPRCRSAGGTGV
jgi:hypothetical protein